MVEPLAVDRPTGLHHRPPGLGVLQEVEVLLGRPPQPSSSEGNHVEDGRASSEISRIAS